MVGALLPFVAAVFRAAFNGWMPVGDAAYIAVRSRDVLSRHHPWVGTFDGGVLHNLGPLHLDLLAPFVRVWPQLGVAIGSALINATSIVLVWLAARRLLGPIGVVAVTAGSILFVSTLGLSWLIDPRPQYAMVLPFYALLWLFAAMCAGARWAVPTAVAVGSLCVQAHTTYWYATSLVVLTGIIGFLFTSLRNDGPTSRLREVGAISAAVAVACWAQPMIDQIAGTGNLGKALEAVLGESGAGLRSGLRVMAAGPLAPPFWLPGSIDDARELADITPRGAIFVLIEWTCAAALVLWRATVERSVRTRSLALPALVSVFIAVVAASRVPSTVFGLAPSNYYWVWSVGAFAPLALAVAVGSLPSVVRRLERAPALLVHRIAPVAAMIAVLGLALWPRYPVASVAADEAEAARVGRPLREQLGVSLHTHLVDQLVEVDISEGVFGNYAFVVIAELQRAGIDFRFAGRNFGLGESRCADAGYYQHVSLIVGPVPAIVPESRVIAEVAGVSPGEMAEYERLGQRFGDLLRDGVVAVAIERLERVPTIDTGGVRKVLATPGLTAEGLAQTLAGWRRWGWVTVPATEDENFEQWMELEHRVAAEFITVTLTDPSEPLRSVGC